MKTLILQLKPTANHDLTRRKIYNIGSWLAKRYGYDGWWSVSDWSENYVKFLLDNNDKNPDYKSLI